MLAAPKYQSPLKNIRVLDLSRVFAMPFAGANLADLGAEVIKIDTCQAQFMDTTRTLTGPFPDNRPGELWWEQGGTFQNLNRGKRSLTLDLRSEESQKIIKELVRVCDVVLENFTPRVMARFGLDFKSLQAEKPDLVMVSNTGYGHSGPWSSFGAMASALEPTHGTGAFRGYMEEGADGRLAEGQVPNKMGNSYSDFLATWTALGALMAALLRRARTGEGQWIDLAMYQTGTTVIGTGVLDFVFNQRRTQRIGNRHPFWSPHGVYPCKESDDILDGVEVSRTGGRWCAISVTTENEWHALCKAMRNPPWTKEERFSTFSGRRENQDELDSLLGQWTARHEARELMEALQEAGVPAGVVQSQSDLWRDPQLKHQSYFQWLDHTECGPMPYDGLQFLMSRSPGSLRMPQALIGQHNDVILREKLGMSDSEIGDLVVEGVLEAS